MKRLIPALVLVSLPSTAAELTLFDVKLRTATRASIVEAVKRAGGKLQSQNKSIDKFDASLIGLPDATEFEIVYIGDEVVMAQYQVTDSERLRKMLTAKYGQPNNGQPKNGRTFDSQYISDGKYRWQFDGQMELVYSMPWGSSTAYLSYVNKSNEMRLGQLLKDAQDKDARKAAQDKKSIF